MTDLNGASFQSVTIRESQPGDLSKFVNVGDGVFSTDNYSLKDLMAFAFDVPTEDISGPQTLGAHYNIEAKAPGAFMATGYGTVDSARGMVRKMLAGRFQLRFHRSTQSLSVYVLTASATGTHLQEAPPGEVGPLRSEGPSFIGGRALRMDDFDELLSLRMEHPILDQTGLTKTYDIKVNWNADSAAGSKSGDTPPTTLPNPRPEVIIKALQTQLGLTARLEQRLVEVLIVDRVRPPKELLAARKPVPMDPHLFDACVGNYEFRGDALVSVSYENDHYWIQLHGQRHVEVFPEGPRDFFAAAVDAQILFVADSEGRITELVLHQGGQDIHAPRTRDAKAKQ